MAELIADCPRCEAQSITFDLKAYTPRDMRHGWQRRYEAFCICRNCHRSTVFVLAADNPNSADYIHNQGLSSLQISANNYVDIEGHISLKDDAAQEPPEHLPDDIKAAFEEGARCLAVDCPNAASTMFRLCVDLGTRTLLPTEEKPGLNAKVRRDLGLRLPWLLDNGFLPEAMRELSSCIKEDGNDGAHAGTLKNEDAQDLLDFSTMLLERLYTEPKRLQLAKDRRDARRADKK